MADTEAVFDGHGRYLLLERLGDGGGGVVYRARDRQRGIQVALKVMHARGGEAPDLSPLVERLIEMDHPGLVRVFDAGVHAGRSYVTMEYCEGNALLDYVRRDGQLDEMRLRESLSQVAAGLRALHAERLLHRDVKTENIRVGHDGRAVLLDLDLVKDLDDGESGDVQLAARPVGTALYMAPEQAASGRVGFACDWYGLGVVLFECLCGSLPFEGAELDVLLRKQSQRAPRASSRAPDVPPDLDALCSDLLQTDPDARPDGVEVLRRLGVHEDVVSGRLSLLSLLSARTPFVGRDHALEVLAEELRRSREGVRVVRLTGSAGVGKTALCVEHLRRARQHEGCPLILYSSCARFPASPHAAVQGAVTRLVDFLRAGQPAAQVPISATSLRLLENAFPGVVAGLSAYTAGRGADVPDPLEQRWRALDALRTLFVEVSRERPVLWCVDDYQWADLDTQRLLRSLVVGSGAPHLSLVLAGEMALGTQHPVPLPDETFLCLEPLSEPAARAVAEALYERATAQSSKMSATLWEGGGAPLLVQERVRHALYFDAAPDPALSVESLLRVRIETLSQSALALLRILCCAFDPLPRDVAERASELSRREFSRHVSMLRVAGLARQLDRDNEDFLAPAHPAVVDVVESVLDPQQRLRCHVRLVAGLLAREPTLAAGHLLRHQGIGGLHEEAARSARLAAEQAHAGLGFQRAAELFTLCASLDLPRVDRQGHVGLRRMGDALAHAGWSLQAASVYREAAQRARADDALIMRQRAAEHLIRAHEIDEGMEALRELLASIDVELPRGGGGAGVVTWARRSWLSLRGLHFRAVEEGQVPARDLRRIDVMWAVALQLGLVDLMRGGDFATRGLLLALDTGEPVRVARALCTEAWMTTGADGRSPQRSDAVLRTARQLVESLDVPYLHGQLKLAEGLVAFSEYRLEDSQVHCRDAERVLRDHCSDVIWETHAAQSYRLIALIFTGRFEAFRRKLEVCLREAEERGDVWGGGNFQSLGALHSALMGDTREASGVSMRPSKPPESGIETFHFKDMFSLLTRVYRRLAADQDALEVLESFWPRLRDHAFLRAHFAQTTLLELRGRARIARARATGQPGLADEAAEDAQSLARAGDPAGEGLAMLLRANLAMLRGEPKIAEQTLERGVAQLTPLHLHLWLPAARHALGGLKGGERGRTLQAQAQAELRERGVRDVRRFLRLMMPAAG